MTPATSYPRKPDGSVDWRAMVRPQHLYVKGEHKEAVAKLLNKPITEIYDLPAADIANVPDRYLVIRKAGILELARLRGYSKIIPTVQHAQRDYVIVRTLITWNAFEGQPSIKTGGVGEANPENTTKLGCAYLSATAKNRAIAIAVRDFLEIDIVCSDELGQQGAEPERESVPPASSSTVAGNGGASMDLGPIGSLKRAAESSSFTFDQVKNAAKKRWDEDTKILEETPTAVRRIEHDPSEWADFDSIDKRDALTLIALIKAAKAARAANTAAAATAAATAASTTATTVTPAAKKVRAIRTAKTAPAADESPAVGDLTTLPTGASTEAEAA